MSHDADVLHRLTAHLRGAAGAYRRAGADGPGLSDVFGAGADAHARTAEELSAMLHAMEVPRSDERLPEGSTWAALPRAVAEGPRATAEAVERAEASLLSDFQAAMVDGDVSVPVRDAVVRAIAGLKAGHDRALQRLHALAD